jgi:(5-formylfuran-3-yl)methyl phosphate synthase
MTGLLVSVRNADEAAVALAAGVDVIDVKEPRHGSLGAASSETIQSVVKLVGNRAVVSAACGELADWSASASSDLSLHGLSLAKIALAQCEHKPDWKRRWQDWAEALPAGTKPVGVVYADRALAGSPAWQEIVALAVEIRSPYVLVDTFDKSAGTLFDHWTTATLREFTTATRAAGIGFVLAGSLRGQAILRAREFEPDFVAVRGAACHGGRTGSVDATAIHQILTMLGGQRPNNRGRVSGISTLRPAN